MCVTLLQSSKNHNNEKHDEVYPENYRMQSLKAQKTSMRTKSKAPVYHHTSSKTLKRASPYSSPAGKKFRGAIVSNPPEFPRQVNVASARRNQHELVRCSLATNLETDMSSVGSCSDSYTLPRHFSSGPAGCLDSGDAESFFRWRGEEDMCVVPIKEDLGDVIHGLELQAYRCTMEALHASGPLSWEQEEMMTNLRLSLHISNDEHLSELKNLVSADTSVILR